MQSVKTTSGNMRDSNLELLRIIGILLIIAHHYVVNSGIQDVNDMPLLDVALANHLDSRAVFFLLFGAWGKTCINTFVFITGWFMCKSDISWRKLAHFVFLILFYNFLFLALFRIFGRGESVDYLRIVSLISPFSTGTNSDYFTSCYLLFFLSLPLLKTMVSALTQKQHLALVCLCVGAYSIYPSIPGMASTCDYLIWFPILFFIASYLRFYPPKWTSDSKTCWAAFAVSLFLGIASVIAWAKWSDSISPALHVTHCFLLSDSNKILALAIGVSSFFCFKNMKIPRSGIINTLASATFGVLTIHANSWEMRHFLWRDLFQNVNHYGAEHYILYPVLSVLAVYFGCAIIELLRQRFIERPLLPKLCDKLHIPGRR
ncbi:MAG: hypothetical protein MJ025_04080 [Victivallaceae bacterium]|nr:hypothetical protein [Victivallaceae bacterium]